MSKKRNSFYTVFSYVRNGSKLTISAHEEKSEKIVFSFDLIQGKTRQPASTSTIRFPEDHEFTHEEILAIAKTIDRLESYGIVFDAQIPYEKVMYAFAHFYQKATKSGSWRKVSASYRQLVAETTSGIMALSENPMSEYTATFEDDLFIRFQLHEGESRFNALQKAIMNSKDHDPMQKSSMLLKLLQVTENGMKPENTKELLARVDHTGKGGIMTYEELMQTLHDICRKSYVTFKAKFETAPEPEPEPEPEEVNGTEKTIE